MAQIGKFDLLATHSYVRAKLSGSNDAQAKEYGYMIAVMGARGRGGHGASKSSGASATISATKKVKPTSAFSANDYDGKIVSKMGDFYKNEFLPAVQRLVQAGMTYDQIKKAVDFPAVRGAKLEGNVFVQRAARVEMEAGE